VTYEPAVIDELMGNGRMEQEEQSGFADGFARIFGKPQKNLQIFS
jgi:hypothetical protein